MSRDRPVANDRYRAQGAAVESEPGSRGRVLRNLLGIKWVREMARCESEALLAASERLIDDTDQEHRFSAANVCAMHRLWLGRIYAWAGEYRQVNLVKGDFPFAAANLVPRLMGEFERGPLREFTPCRIADPAGQAHAMAVVHAELVLIHPFREGNGRLRAAACAADGVAGRPAGAGLRRDSWRGTAALLRGRAGGTGPELCADDGGIRACCRANHATVG